MTCSVDVRVVVVRADASFAMKLARMYCELGLSCIASLTFVIGSSDWLNAVLSSAALRQHYDPLRMVTLLLLPLLLLVDS